jgi:hypothetical protein
MPKDDIDYSKTIIYKIICKDEKVSDVYVGHTTNFVKRKFQHKTSCKNLNNKLKIYEIIRQNGGWDNWEMINVATYNCKNKEEACIKEQKHYEEIKPSLNSCPPYVSPFKYYCDICNINCLCSEGLKKHLNTNKHNSILKFKTINTDKKNVDNLFTDVDINSQNSQQHFYCKKCDYNTSRKSDFNKHNLSAKHRNVDIMLTNVDANSQKVTKEKYVCDCGKEYKHRQCLYVHRKTCDFNSKIEVPNNNNNDKLVEYLMKENSELKHMIIDVCKNINTNSSQNNHSFNNTNSHNKTFNLQFFLNETCKDAMNIMDFAESVKLQLSDLEKVGEIGYVDGISNIIVKNLIALDETKRPVHCTDTKREVLYIKDDNKWEKEDLEKKKIRKLIKKVADKNARLIPKFKEEHPDCVKSVSKFSDQYNKLIVESFDNDAEKEDKIIRKIAKEVTIDKTNI